MPSAWTRLRAAADPLARRVGHYTAYPLHAAEHVRTEAHWSVADAREFLRSRGYEPQYLSAAKRHPRTRQLHDLSYRRVPDDHPDAWDATSWRPEQCQYHVHAFRKAGVVEFYSHYEVRPDPLRPRPNPARLRTHYRPRYGETYLRGVADI